MTDEGEALNEVAIQANMDRLGNEIALCHLNTSTFTVAGVALGVAAVYATKNKNYFYAITGLGVLSDGFYGYYGVCRPLRAEYKACKTQYEVIHPPPVVESRFRNLDRDYTTDVTKSRGYVAPKAVDKEVK
jgi:hypothetical protein